MWQLLLVLAGFVATLAISGRLWETRPRLRYLPIVYGVCVGLTTALVGGERDGWKVLETTMGWGIVGAGGYFSLWIESRARR